MRKDGCISRLINSRRSIKLSLPFSTIVFILQLLPLSDIELDYEHALGFPSFGHSLFACFTASVFCTMHIFVLKDKRETGRSVIAGD